MTRVTRSCSSMGGKTSALRQKSQCNTCKRVLHCMRHHSWTQTFSPVGQQSEHDSVDRDQQHAAFTFVTMPGAEDDGRADESKKKVSGDRCDLALQIPTKYNFFYEAGDRA